MHRFYQPDAKDQTSLTLTDKEAHHAANVLRLRPGETVSVLNGAGGEFLCEVQAVSKRSVALSVKDRKTVISLPYAVTLLQAIPKGKLLDSIIQKATELSVTRVVPLVTTRVVSQFDATEAEDKREKWQQVAIEAIKQCGQPWLPKVETPISISEWLNRKEQIDLPLIASLQPGAQHPRGYFAEHRARHGGSPQSVCIWVGPEGDFTTAEVQEIIAAGAKPITLGPLVLRCETAATYCLSFINYELQE